jgi:hypothetical protein
MDRLKAVLLLLIEEKPLPFEWGDHLSKGNRQDFATCTSSRIGYCSIALKTVSYDLPVRAHIRICSTSDIFRARLGVTRCDSSFAMNLGGG